MTPYSASTAPGCPHGPAKPATPAMRVRRMVRRPASSPMRRRLPGESHSTCLFKSLLSAQDPPPVKTTPRSVIFFSDPASGRTSGNRGNIEKQVPCPSEEGHGARSGESDVGRCGQAACVVTAVYSSTAVGATTSFFLFPGPWARLDQIL